MPGFLPVDRSTAIAVSAGFAAGVGAALLWAAARPAKADGGSGGDDAVASGAASTTSSGHSGSVYESSKAVSEYLQFHFGSAKDLLPYADGPHSALNFASRCVPYLDRAPDRCALRRGAAVCSPSLLPTADPAHACAAPRSCASSGRRGPA